MGKRPVFGLIGLVWAGMLVAGCGECCRNNTRKGTPPTAGFPTKMSQPERETPRDITSPTISSEGRATDKDWTPPPAKPPVETGAPITPSGGAGMGAGKKTSALPPDTAAPTDVKTLKQPTGFTTTSPTTDPRLQVPPPPVTGRKDQPKTGNDLTPLPTPANEQPPRPHSAGVPPTSTAPASSPTPSGIPPLPGDTPPYPPPPGQ